MRQHKVGQKNKAKLNPQRVSSHPERSQGCAGEGGGGGGTGVLHIHELLFSSPGDSPLPLESWVVESQGSLELGGLSREHSPGAMRHWQALVPGHEPKRWAGTRRNQAAGFKLKCSFCQPGDSTTVVESTVSRGRFS